MNAYVILSSTLCISDFFMLLFTGIPAAVTFYRLRASLGDPFCTTSGWFLNFNIRLCSFITTCICTVRCYVILAPLRAKILLGSGVLAAVAL